MNAPHPSTPRSPARFARALVAGAFVAGIAALVALQTGVGDAPPSSAVATGSTAYLHAPAADPSLPAAEHVFRHRPASVEESPPTF